MSATEFSQQHASTASTKRRLLYIGLAFAGISLAVVAGIVAVAVVATDGGGLASTVIVIRDLFVILLLLQLLLVGAALTVLILQIARFTNLIRSEALPIIASSSEMVDNIRGTTAFLGQHLVEPLMQVNSVVAGAREAMRLAKDFKGLRDLIMKVAQDSNFSPEAPEAE